MLDLVWHMHLNCSGYSMSGQDFVRSLIRKEYPVAIDKDDYPNSYKFSGLSDYTIRMFHDLQYKKPPDNTLGVWNFPPSQFKKISKINIGYADYEVSHVPDLWVDSCNEMDELWTSSSFCKKVFMESGVSRDIKVIPHAIDDNLWHPEVEPLPIKNRKDFCFLFVSEWMPRKGIYELLRAWYSAFNNKDDVCLILKTYLGSHRNIDNIKREIVQVRHEFNLPQDKCAPILFYSDFLQDDKMPQLFKCADVLVAPSLGEGFGLPVAQAQMMGIPTIVTDWGSLPELCNNEIGYMIEIDGVEKVSQKQIDLIPAYENAEWAKINLDSLISIMKHVYNNSHELKEKSNKCKDFIQKFNYDNVGELLTENLNRVLSTEDDFKDVKCLHFDETTGKIGQKYSGRILVKKDDMKDIEDFIFVNYFSHQKFAKIYIGENSYIWGKVVK